MKTKTASKGEGVSLLCMLRDNDGTIFTSGEYSAGTAAFVLSKDFSPFGSVATTGVTTTFLSVPKGTVENPDPRWIPGIDGGSGFNFEVTIPASNFTQAGTYFASIRFTKSGTDAWSDVQTFRIHIGSGT